MEEGRPAYHPALLLKVWLYAYALGVTSARRLEQQVREDLAFRHLAAGAGPDFWTLNQFRTGHARALTPWDRLKRHSPRSGTRIRRFHRSRSCRGDPPIGRGIGVVLGGQ